jgi:alpha-tubulin suppressor-like RCC1 family protein
MHLSSGTTSSCGLREDSSVACWGDPIEYSDIPPTVRLSSLAMGPADLVCGLQSGELSCWGAAALDLALPSSTTYRAVESGIDFSCGIDRLGDLLCKGQIDPPPTDGPFVALAAGGRHACALRDDRTLACWGLGDADDPDDGTDPRGQSWGQAVPPPGEFVYVASGNTFSCALRANGDITCWGQGSIDGGCLNGGRDNCGTLLAPPGPFVELGLGSTYGCGLRPDNSVSCWGGSSERSSPPPGPL